MASRHPYPSSGFGQTSSSRSDCHIYAKFKYNILEAGVTSGSAALAAEVCKHNANDAKCSELGWTCIPIAVETYGCWGAEAMQTLTPLASRLATRGNCSKSHATCLLYGRLSLTLMRANAWALLSPADY